jgi:hypothetical protein
VSSVGYIASKTCRDAQLNEADYSVAGTDLELLFENGSGHGDQ